MKSIAGALERSFNISNLPPERGTSSSRPAANRKSFAFIPFGQTDLAKIHKTETVLFPLKQ